MGCPIRISTDQSLLAAPHGFSQRATSFIASWCQGIHRMPLSRSKHQTHAQEPSILGQNPSLRTVIPNTTLLSRTPEHTTTLGSDTRSRHAQMRTNLFTLTKNTIRQDSTRPRPRAQHAPSSLIQLSHSDLASLPTASTPAWWRRTGSNRQPPACKAGALPTELRPQNWWAPNWWAPNWWAREDSNLRPHAYQACALTN